MAQERIQMPASGGGLIRYSEEYKSKISFNPIILIAIIILIVIIELFLYYNPPLI